MATPKYQYPPGFSSLSYKEQYAYIKSRPELLRAKREKCRVSASKRLARERALAKTENNAQHCDGYIYIARSEYRPRHFKVGYTRNPRQRLRLYLTGDPSIHMWKVRPIETDPSGREQRCLSLLDRIGITRIRFTEWYNVREPDEDVFVRIFENC